MSKPFSFANLLGGGQRSRATAEEDAATESDEDKAATDGEEVENDEDAAESEDDTSQVDDDEADSDEEDDTAGSDEKTARRAVLAERRRISGILAMATPDTVAQAAVLATQTDLTVAQARAALAAAPKASGGLSAAMRGRAGTPVASSSGGRAAGNLPQELQAAQARRVSKDR